MRRSVFFAIATAFLMSACASVDTPEAADAEPASAASPDALAAWDKWRANENAAWAGKEFAILKIDDAVYLKDGQSAWLTNKKQKVLQYAWTLEAKAAPKGLRVTYGSGKAEVRYKGQTQSLRLRRCKR
jgi:hypothetical protein